MARFFALQCCLVEDPTSETAAVVTAVLPTEEKTGGSSEHEVAWHQALTKDGKDTYTRESSGSTCADTLPGGESRKARSSLIQSAGSSPASSNASTSSPTLSSLDPFERSRSGSKTMASEVEPPLRLTDAMIEESIEQVAAEISMWNWDDYTFQKVIQKAPCNHGEVLLVHSKAGEKIAAKKMPNSWVREGYKSFKHTYQTAESPWYDMAILRLLNKMSFAYVCKFQGVYRDFHDTYVCSEFATQGDLFVWCTGTSLECGPTREKVVQPMMAQLLTAVMVLHDMNIAHRDISIENILLTDNPDGSTRVLLVDFGMAIASRECSRNAFGKKHFRAPELHKPQAAYDVFLVDDFALGVVLFCWIVSDHPWTNTNNDCPLFRYFRDNGLGAFLRRRKFRSGKSYLSDNISTQVVEVLEGLMQCNPAKRSCVGEEVYREEPMKHASVWDKAWLYSLAPKASEALGCSKGLEPFSQLSRHSMDRVEGELRVIV